MSKTLLKKEIHSMTKAQLEELILDAYDFRKEIKQYFDYFLNPNVEKLYDTYSAAVCKELSRGKRGNSKARITVLRRLLREFAAYRPGYDMEINLLVYTIRRRSACCASPTPSAAASATCCCRPSPWPTATLWPTRCSSSSPPSSTAPTPAPATSGSISSDVSRNIPPPDPSLSGKFC